MDSHEAYCKMYMRHLIPKGSSAEDAIQLSQSRDSYSPTEVNHVFIGDHHNFIGVKVNGKDYFRPLEPLFFFKCRKLAPEYFYVEEFGIMVPFFLQDNGHFDHKYSSKYVVESYTCYYQ